MSIFRDGRVIIHSQRNDLSPYKRRLDVSAIVEGGVGRIVWHDNDGGATFSQGDTFEINGKKVDGLPQYKDALEEKVISSYQVLSDVGDYFEALPPADYRYSGSHKMCRYAGPVFTVFPKYSEESNCYYVDRMSFFDDDLPFQTSLNGDKSVIIKYSSDGDVVTVNASESRLKHSPGIASCAFEGSKATYIRIDSDSPDRELIRGLELFFQLNAEELDSGKDDCR